MKHKKPKIEHHASVLDTLAVAREMHPGQRNSLDALCKRYEVDATKRDVHGALIDSELLANVYLAMTGGQTNLSLDVGALPERDLSRPGHPHGHKAAPVKRDRGPAESIAGSRPGAAPTSDLPVIEASKEESASHDAMLEKIRKSGACVWDID